MTDPQEDYKEEIEDLPEFQPSGCFLFWIGKAVDDVHRHLQRKHPAAYNAGYARGRSRGFWRGALLGVLLAVLVVVFRTWYG